MTQHEDLDRQLKSLASRLPQHPAPATEALLLNAFKSHHRRRRQRQTVFACAASFAIMALAAQLLIPQHQAKPMPPAPMPPAPPVIADIAKAPAPRPEPVTRPHRLKRIPVVKPPQAEPDPLAGFVPLPYAASGVPLGTPVILRVQIPASQVTLIGFPDSRRRPGEQVKADVLLGADGLTRAIRFVP